MFWLQPIWTSGVMFGSVHLPVVHCCMYWLKVKLLGQVRRETLLSIRRKYLRQSSGCGYLFTKAEQEKSSNAATKTCKWYKCLLATLRVITAMFWGFKAAGILRHWANWKAVINSLKYCSGSYSRLNSPRPLDFVDRNVDKHLAVDVKYLVISFKTWLFTYFSII